MSSVKNAVNGLLKGEERKQAADYIERYTREMRESFAIMKELLLNGKGFLTNLFALGRPAMFYPLLIKAWKFDESDRKGQFRKVVRLAEIHSFRVIGIGRKRSDTGRETYYALARDFKGDFENVMRRLKETI